ncbi:MAG: DUF4491 family protein [Anaerolineales bacterium]|nr:DUF4491 family protein [Anaerolineales bacterium]
MNPLGIITALSTFIGIWLGHVSVRAIEWRAKDLRLPIVVALILGIAFEIFSYATDSKLFSAATGIFGMTILWDALELRRQEKRVQRGHAPANPANPRHQSILDKKKRTTENSETTERF